MVLQSSTPRREILIGAKPCLADGLTIFFERFSSKNTSSSREFYLSFVDSYCSCLSWIQQNDRIFHSRFMNLALEAEFD